MDNNSQTEDIIGQIFGFDSDNVFGEAPPEGEAGVATNAASTEGEGASDGKVADGGQSATDGSDVDQQRFEHWQSKHDKVKSEYDKYKEQVEAMTPILRYVNSDPAIASRVLATIEESLNSSPANGVAVSGRAGGPEARNESQPELKEPVAPEAPSDYDEFQAYNEPGSASFKYRKQFEKYKDDLNEYRYKLTVGKMESELSSVKQQLEAERKQKEQQASISQTYNTLVSEMDMQPSEAKEFLQWAQSPEYTLKDLADLYRIRNGGLPSGKQQAPKQPQRVESPLRKPVDFPLPSGTQGSSQDSRSVEDKLFEAFTAPKNSSPFNYG